MCGLLIHGQFNQLLWTCHVLVLSSLTLTVAHIYIMALVVLSDSPHLIASSDGQFWLPDSDDGFDCLQLVHDIHRKYVEWFIIIIIIN